MLPAAPESSSDLCSGLDNLSRDKIKRLQREDNCISLFYNLISIYAMKSLTRDYLYNSSMAARLTSLSNPIWPPVRLSH